MLAGLVAVQVAVRADDARAGTVLAWAGAAMLSIYAVLVLANLWLLAVAPWARKGPAVE